MITTGFESRVKIQQIIQNQLPEFILDESPKTVDFLKQYYISQEYQGGPVDIVDNLDQYLKLDNLIPEVIKGSTVLSSSISATDVEISVESTKGFPDRYGLLKIDDEVITYTNKNETTFIGCIRGFSGVTDYHKDLEYEELVFSTSTSSSHTSDSVVENLSVLFLQEFYKKIKYSLTPGLEDLKFVSDLNVGNFIKEARTFYQSKGTTESFRILFNVLYGEDPEIIDMERFLIKSSNADYIRRQVIIAERISGDPALLSGQTIYSESSREISASVSEVEIITRNGKTYYKLLLFLGYDDVDSSSLSDFKITPTTRCIDDIVPGSSVITVDSTLGFSPNGKLYANNHTIRYTSKSINQFFGCYSDGSNLISIEIPKTTPIISDYTYYGYENGDITKKISFRTTGVLSNLIMDSPDSGLLEGNLVTVKNVGEIIENPTTNKTYKQINANSWIYNASSRYQIKSYSGSSLVTQSDIYKSGLKVGDYIEFLERNTEILVPELTNTIISAISNNTVTVGSNISILNPLKKYDIRRKIKKATSSIVPIGIGTDTSLNENIFADIQNVYSDKNEYLYVASNSLPSYEIESNIFEYMVSGISGYDGDTKSYSILQFNTPISFLIGDEIDYNFSNLPIEGLTARTYYVEVLSQTTIKLYTSRNFIGTDNNVKFGQFPGNLPSGTHKFILSSQRDKIISPQTLLRKFNLNPQNDEIIGDETIPGSVGMLINGVEIINYKSNDKIYYGPLEKVSVLNGGSNYDVINPPQIQVSGNASVQPVVQGSVERIYIDSQDFNIDKIVSINLSGGNGSGSILKPIIIANRREIDFDARRISKGGGLDFDNERITFLSKHNLINGQKIVYDSNGSSEIGIGLFGGSNLDTNQTLISNSVYYARILNERVIKVHKTFFDAISGINTVGFTTIGNSGIQKFKTEIRNNLTEIKVINGGSGYTNRKLIVKPVGISTYYDTINFTNHGFSDGEIVRYSYQNSGIVGLSTLNSYYVFKKDDNAFRLCDAGIGATISENYERKTYVNISTTGTGYQIFNYPEISLSVTYSSIGIGSTEIRGEISATPVIRGTIIDAYVYENGSNYGSNILNYHKKPTIKILTGTDAQLKPIVVNGKISNVLVLFGGSNYISNPDIKVSGKGTGALFRSVVTNGKITSIIVVSGGIGYESDSTSILAERPGKNSVFDAQVRSLSSNKSYQYGMQNIFYREPANQILIKSNNNLQYFVCGYSETLKNQFNDPDPTTNHSPIIGWAYDGNPIYGPYGYSNPNNRNSPIKRIVTGYASTTIVNRPSGFDLGFFNEDYIFNNSGDLDENNGRFCITPDFPNGVYAYFASTVEDPSGDTVGQYPYFIGNTYRSKFVKENITLNQSYDFNSTSLLRNTLPYNANQKYSGNDFIIESNELINQTTSIESVIRGKVDSFDIINSGDGYKVDDKLDFDQTNSGGYGIYAEVSEVFGKDIVRINTSTVSYNDSLIVRENFDKLKVVINPYHDFTNGDTISISGLSTNLFLLNNFYKVGLTTYSSSLLKNIGDASTTGIVTNIPLSSIPKNISIGSSIKIGNEILSILNIYDQPNVLKVRRNASGIAYTETTPIYFLPNSFEIYKDTDPFESKDTKISFFNPRFALGIGTTPGLASNKDYYIDNVKYTTSTTTQSIFLPNHPYQTGQKVILKRPAGTTGISAADTPTSGSFGLLVSSTTEILYAINKSKDYIGIVTNRSLVSSTNGLFFPVVTGSNNEFYQFESVEKQVKVNINKIESTVSVSTSHLLQKGDVIKLTVNPNTSVGIGTSIAVRIKFNDIFKKLLVNPINIASSSIDIQSNIITIPSHNYNTGDSVFYNSADTIATGLQTGRYFVCRIDDNNIKLSETYYDCFSNTPRTVEISSQGGDLQELSLINPPLEFVKNNQIVFDVSDSSLYGYDFKFYYDNTFKNEFVSVATTSTSGSFSILGIGTVGQPAIGATSTKMINYSPDLPKKLFYNLEKLGNPLELDDFTQNFSKITFVDSVYTGQYPVYGVGTTTFKISLNNFPERFSYTKNQCDILKYSTTSKTATGGIGKVSIISSGFNYKELPVYIGTKSLSGDGAYIIPRSSSIGRKNQIRIINEGFEYSSDKTLSPEALIPKVVTLESSSFLSSVEIINGGKNYSTEPNLVVVNSDTGKKIDSGVIRCKLNGSTISSIIIDKIPKGLPFKKVTLRTTNNSNGIRIVEIETSPSGIATCYISTPIVGFSTDPLVAGDKVYIEGITNYVDGLGFNSENHGYQFFDVTRYYLNSNPGKFEFKIPTLYGNPGIAKTVQNSFASFIKYDNYPQFSVSQKLSTFFIGEKIISDNGFGFKETDLIVTGSNGNYVRLSGNYNLSPNEIIKGSSSFTIGTVNKVDIIRGNFIVDYSNRQNIGWRDDSGKIGEDTQVIPDNNYYQNLSYTIKSTREWEEIVTPVNNLVHTIGTKNFTDKQITKNAQSGLATASDPIVSAIVDYIQESNVTTINNIDFGIDIDPLSDATQIIKFKNIKLSDYIQCNTNRVLQIDNISPLFSSVEDEKDRTFSIILPLDITKRLTKALLQIRKITTGSPEIQFMEVVVINDDRNVYTLVKGLLSNKYTPIAEVAGVIDSFNTFYLKFVPEDVYDSDYDIKILKTEFNTPQSGISTYSIGFTNLSASNKLVGVGTTSVIAFQASKVNSFFTSVELIDIDTNKMDYVDFYVAHDGTDVYYSEFHFDDSNSNIGNYIGSFSPQLSNGIISLNFSNTNSISPGKTGRVRYSSKTVGFGSTAVGIGTYRFKFPRQRNGSESTALYESSYTRSSTSTDIISFDSTRFSSLKSTVKVGYGKTIALHQILMIHDGTDVYTTQYPFLSIGSTSGIGSFGGYFSGSALKLRFYPDSTTAGQNLEILTFTEAFYTNLDEVNVPPKLLYSPISESLSIAKYYGVNSLRVDRLNFDLNYNGTPIFKKTFDPEDTDTLDLTTHTFTINNHFFSTGEELIYRPKSTFIGVGTAPMGIGLTANYLGITTNLLPPIVYPIKLDNSRFRLATRKEYATAGIYVTFTSFGEGNAHELEMVKKNEKSFITISNLAQYPLSYTSNLQTLVGNSGGGIGIGNTIVALSGIGTVTIENIIKVDDEYMKVINVGFGTTSIGPITFTGNVPLVQVTRGFCGTASSTHLNGSSARIYKGSYNIVGNEIFFTNPPRGNIFDLVGFDNSNLVRERAKFNGRVFLRKNYRTNTVYDDFSEKFDGITNTFTLTNTGINTVGLGTTAGNGLLFINGIFQTPTTENATFSNYQIIEDNSAGISSVRFTGITSSNGSLIISQSDQNQNQLPRGGMIVSLGSTSGLGYAPLVGLSVTAILNGSGTIVGFGTTGNFGSGYRAPISIRVMDENHTGAAATITATVGVGGTLRLNVVNGGSGYVRPSIIAPSPSYENMPVVGISRLGIGATTTTGVGLLMNLEIGPSNRVGIGSTLFEVSSFKITRPGYSFKIGDEFTVAGLVTAKSLNSPIEPFKLTVLEVFNDTFAAIQFGEMNYIDSIRRLQDGTRTRFPLYYNSELLSFEANRDDPDSSLIDFDSLLVIYINGILQDPKSAYNFSGGTSFTFTTPPKAEDEVSIFFYTGTRDEDSTRISVNELIQQGDTLQINSNNNISGTITQDDRIVYDIIGSDRLETNTYTGKGIDGTNFKPIYWTKQKRDYLINETVVPKSRDSIEPQVYPTAKIIKNFSSSDTELYLDNAQFFDYEDESPVSTFDCLIVNDENTFVPAEVTANVTIDGIVGSLNIVQSGGGYIGTEVSIKISPPQSIGVGIGTTATAKIKITNGSLTSPITITNPGLGYESDSPPKIIVPSPSTSTNIELLKDVSIVRGFDGVITGIATAPGLNGASLALKFTIFRNPPLYTDLQVGYPIYINNTRVGNGVTSIYNSNSSVIGIGTICLDNIYYVDAIDTTLGIITCNIRSNTSIVGIATTGTNNYPVGRFSWGKLGGFGRTNNISIAVTGKTLDVGLTTFASVQRRGYGLRNTGSLKKRIMGL
jgi:hypothetical protein